MELPLEISSLSTLSKRDLKKGPSQNLLVPATTALIPGLVATTTSEGRGEVGVGGGNAWLTPPASINHEVKKVNFDLETREGEQAFSQFIRQPREFRCHPHNLHDVVQTQVHCGFVRRAVGLEESCMAELEMFLLDEKRGSVRHINAAVEAIRRAEGRKLLLTRGGLVVLCVFLAALICIHWSHLVAIPVMLAFLVVVLKEFSQQDVFVENGRNFRREQLQLEMDALLHSLNKPVSLTPLDLNNLSLRHQVYFCFDVAFQFIQLALFFTVLAVVHARWTPLVTGVTFSQVTNYLTLLVLGRGVSLMLSARRAARVQMETEIESIAIQMHNINCTFDVKSNAYLFPATSTSSPFLLTRSRSACLPHVWSVLNNAIFSELNSRRDDLRKAIWRSKLGALEAKVSELVRHEVWSQADDAPSHVGFLSDVFSSNRNGLPMCVFALLDLFEEDVILSKDDRRRYEHLKEQMCEIENHEMLRLRDLVVYKSIVLSPERYNLTKHLAASKRVLFNPEAQEHVLCSVRDSLVRYTLQSIHLRSEEPFLDPVEAQARVALLEAEMAEASLDRPRGCEGGGEAADQARNPQSVLKTLRALKHMRYHVQLFCVETREEKVRAQQKREAVEGPRDPDTRAVPRYYHPSLFRGEGGECSEAPAWDCCQREGEDAVGCRVEYVQKGRRLQVSHHPMRWCRERQCYACCLQETRSAAGCMLGFSSSPFGSSSASSAAETVNQ